MLNLTLVSFSVVMMRLLAHEGHDIHDMFVAATILTGLLPISLFMFIHDYFDAWMVWRRWLIRVVVAFLVMVTVGLSLETFLHLPLVIAPNSVYVAIDGTINYQYGSLVMISVPFVVLAETLLVVAFYTVFRLYNQKQNVLNRRVMLGVTVLVTGMFIVPIPGLEHYAFEQIFYVAGSLILIRPVLGRRLFDPLSQANEVLAHRAEQMALINRVGDKAHSVLNLAQLLPDVAEQIRRSFSYHRVQIEVYDDQDRPIERVVSFAGRTLTQWDDTALKENVAQSRFMPILDIPLEIGSPNAETRLRGVMTIQHEHRHTFNAEEREVLHILAKQIAQAISNAQLFQDVQRANAAKTALISTVSHELRNNVGDVINISKDMLEEPLDYEGQSLPDVYRPDVQHLLDTGNHQRQLLNDVVDWSKIEAGIVDVNPRPIDPLPILQEAVRNAPGMVQNEVRISFEFPALPMLKAHDIRVKQIIRNLVSNAAKFTTEGSITIRAEVVGDYVQFSVADTGIGMTEQEQARLFQLYSQASPAIQSKYGGSGMGLAICEDFVKMHGGRIWVESAPGKGSTFYFTLPIAKRADLEPGIDNVRSVAEPTQVQKASQ